MSSNSSPIAEPDAYESTKRRSRHRGKLWLAAIAGLLLLVLLLAPPLVHVNRYSREIAQTMSASLGRPVHLDNVSLGLFPVPHITLQNVVVSEDPAFGSEPIIRANVVEANLRASSLWRRPMEFSRVRFVEPSVNLVRNAEGRWNLEGVLVRASQVQTAPTAQAHKGPAPRFPYIEATGGRVNIKMGDEKKPFSLVDADFALWLPSAQQWRVRLTGTPARTDTNLADSGVVRMEGSFDRAAHMGQVPVTLHASWHDAPLGDATRLFTGEDQGWRGTVQVDAALQGRLGAGRLETDVSFDDVRRADFVPVHTLSVHLHCAALANAPAALLQNAACSFPAGTPEPLRFQAETLDLTHPLSAGMTAEAEKLPLEWFASWARVLTPRFPATALPGSLDATLVRSAVSGAESALPTEGPRLLNSWTGTLTAHLPLPQTPTLPRGSNEREQPASTAQSSQAIAAEIDGDPVEGTRLNLVPSPVRLASGTALVFSGSATKMGYLVHVTGQGVPAVLLSLARKLPPLGDGLASALGLEAAAPLPAAGPQSAAAAQSAAGPLPAAALSEPAHIDVTCSRRWSSADGDQRCVRAPDLPHRPATAKTRR